MFLVFFFFIKEQKNEMVEWYALRSSIFVHILIKHKIVDVIRDVLWIDLL